MDQDYQGDNQVPLLPVDFDMDWSLLEDDWGSRTSRTEDGAFETNLAITTANQWSLPPNQSEAAPGINQFLPQTFEDQVSQSYGAFDSNSYGVSASQFQGAEHCWMTYSLTSPDALQSSLFSTWDPQPSYKSYCDNAPSSRISGQEQATSTLGNSPAYLDSSIIPISSDGFARSPSLLFPPAESEMKLSNPNQGRPTGNRRRQGTPRLKCDYPGCKSTFSRKYDLERHRKAIHDRTVNILCSVYGCNRISKPFPRLDKFFEHITKHHHRGPERFLCVVETCRQGPLTRGELIDHLNARHSVGRSEQPHFEESLNSLNLGVRYREGNLILIDNFHLCPLRLEGCGYSHPPSPNNMNMDKHLRNHELLERSKVYEDIVAFCDHWSEDCPATCPICGFATRGFKLLHHMGQHTREERIKQAADIAQLFRPYLTGQEKIYSWNDSRKILEWIRDPEFRARVEETGIIMDLSHHIDTLV